MPEIPVQNAGSTENFFCTDRPGAEKIAVAFRQNADCHEQLKEASGTDWVTIGLAALTGLIAGIVVGDLTR